MKAKKWILLDVLVLAILLFASAAFAWMQVQKTVWIIMLIIMLACWIAHNFLVSACIKRSQLSPKRVMKLYWLFRSLYMLIVVSMLVVNYLPEPYNDIRIWLLTAFLWVSGIDWPFQRAHFKNLQKKSTKDNENAS